MLYQAVIVVAVAVLIAVIAVAIALLVVDFGAACVKLWRLRHRPLKRMLVYVAGPYSSPNVHTRNLNVWRAEEAAKQVILRGHCAMCPHTMTFNWEADRRLGYDQFLRNDLEILARCDALLYLGSSRGADMELAAAQKTGKLVFHRVEEVPDISGRPPHVRLRPAPSGGAESEGVCV